MSKHIDNTNNHSNKITKQHPTHYDGEKQRNTVHDRTTGGPNVEKVSSNIATKINSSNSNSFVNQVHKEESKLNEDAFVNKYITNERTPRSTTLLVTPPKSERKKPIGETNNFKFAYKYLIFYCIN